jgi:hypothetical protein
MTYINKQNQNLRNTVRDLRESWFDASERRAFIEGNNNKLFLAGKVIPPAYSLGLISVSLYYFFDSKLPSNFGEIPTSKLVSSLATGLAATACAYIGSRVVDFLCGIKIKKVQERTQKLTASASLNRRYKNYGFLPLSNELGLDRIVTNQ